MLVYLLMQNSINSEWEYCFQNILIQHSNYSEKLLVIHSFQIILQATLMHTYIKLILIIHFVLDDSINYLTPLHSSHQYRSFADAFIILFGYPCFILTQCGVYKFFTFRFIQAVLTLLYQILENNL